MSNKLLTTPLDHLPEDFTLENLKGILSEQEIAALNTGDDPAFPELIEAPEPEATPVEAEAPAPQPEPAPQPVQFDIPDTTEAQAKLEGFDAAMEAVTARYDDGEITRAEMQAELARLAREQATAQAQIETAAQLQKAQQAQIEASVQARQQQWFATVEAYKAKVPDLFADEHFVGFDAAVRAVTGDASLQTLTMQQMLDRAAEAYRLNYTARTGKVLGAPKPADPGKPELRTDEREPPVQTLAGLNGESSADLNAQTFAAIDAIKDPVAREEAIKALPKKTQDAYFEKA